MSGRTSEHFRVTVKPRYVHRISEETAASPRDAQRPDTGLARWCKAASCLIIYRSWVSIYSGQWRPVLWQVMDSRSTLMFWLCLMCQNRWTNHCSPTLSCYGREPRYPLVNVNGCYVEMLSVVIVTVLDPTLPQIVSLWLIIRLSI